MQDTTGRSTADAWGWLKDRITTHTISPMMLDDAFFSVALALADDAVGGEAPDAAATAALAFPVSLGAVMVDIFAALGVPLPDWTDPTQPTPATAA